MLGFSNLPNAVLVQTSELKKIILLKAVVGLLFFFLLYVFTQVSPTALEYQAFVGEIVLEY